MFTLYWAWKVGTATLRRHFAQRCCCWKRRCVFTRQRILFKERHVSTRGFKNLHCTLFTATLMNATFYYESGAPQLEFWQILKAPGEQWRFSFINLVFHCPYPYKGITLQKDAFVVLDTSWFWENLFFWNIVLFNLQENVQVWSFKFTLGLLDKIELKVIPTKTIQI